VEPTVAGFYRVLFGGVLLSGFILYKRFAFWKNKRFLLYALLCSLAFTGDLGLWHQCIRYLGPGLATILGNFQVFFMAAAGVLIFHERLSLRLILGFFLAILGLYLIFGPDWSGLTPAAKIGVFLGLGTALSYAVYVITIRKLQTLSNVDSPEAILGIVSLFAALFLGIVALVQQQSFQIPDARNWLIMIVYALVSQIFAWILISRSLPYIEVSKAGLILLLQPGLAYVWDILFFHRQATPVEISGAVLALVAIYIGSSRKYGGKAAT